MALQTQRRRVLIGSLSARLAALAQPLDTSRARQTVRQYAAGQHIPGMAAAVVRDDTEVFSETAGEADVENHSRVSAASRFRIGSLSKLLTAAAVMRLYEQQVIDLDAPVQRYVPRFPDKGARITSRQLLGHLGGIRHYGANDYLNRTRFATVTEALQKFEDSPLASAPGEKYLYSSNGYNLLGAVIEGAAKQDFPAAVNRLVTGPLQMGATLIDEPDEIIVGRSRPYSFVGGRLVNSPYIDLTDRRPSGGFLSSAADMARFGAAHLSNGFLHESTRGLMFTPQKTIHGDEIGVGLGWRISSIAGERVCHHGGDSVGGRAFLLLRPGRRLAVAILCNLSLARIAEREAMALSDFF